LFRQLVQHLNNQRCRYRFLTNQPAQFCLPEPLILKVLRQELRRYQLPQGQVVYVDDLVFDGLYQRWYFQSLWLRNLRFDQMRFRRTLENQSKKQQRQTQLQTRNYPNERL
jgi:hypothetical protein